MRFSFWNRDTAPNRSIVLIKFRQAEDAAEFIEAYNGRPFNSMEVCFLICTHYVKC